jgi:hypothetical protein
MPPPPPPAAGADREPPAGRTDDCQRNAPARSGTRTGGAKLAAEGKPALLQGELADIAKLIAEARSMPRRSAPALSTPRAGQRARWIGLGETLEARKELGSAARAYGSIIDLFPGRADLRRWAGERLERIGNSARDLAIDTYKRSVADRPDHMTGHRLLAYALLRANRHAGAIAAILAGIDQKYPSGRFNGGDRILRDDAGMIAASYVAALPNRRNEIEGELLKRQLALATAPSTRFILYWETDANDVDFHIQDAKGGHAFYSSKQLPSGASLRRRHQRLRPRVLRDSRQRQRRPLQALDRLLLAGPDGLRDGPPADRSSRRSRQADVRGPPLHHHGRPRDRRPRLVPVVTTSRPRSRRAHVHRDRGARARARAAPCRDRSLRR